MSKRAIKTVYYRDGTIVKMTTALHADKAVAHAVEHMRSNDYEATVAEVFCEDTGKLYAVLRTNVHGLGINDRPVSTPDLMSFYLIKK